MKWPVSSFLTVSLKLDKGCYVTTKKFTSIILCLCFLLPPAQGWGQKYEEQAQFYLQPIGPAQAPSPQRLTPIQTSPQQKTELPPQAATPTSAAPALISAPRQPEETSNEERRARAQRLFLKQFGYSFFYQPPASFLPVQNIPVGPDYIIGPGDSIKIIVWGSVQGEYNLTVNRNGQIDIPKLGVVHVSGLTFSQLRQVMDREFTRQYNNFQMNVTLDNLRTIQVFVVGQARFPGSYAISSLSTLVNALFASGGPSKSGSIRDIQVRRNGKVITRFDMYDFLLRGDKSKDIRLQPEDVIFIPPIGPIAAIGTPMTEDPKEKTEKSNPENDAAAGSPVKVPGIYELRTEKTLTDLLKLAGGLGDTAFKGRMQVLRVKGRQEMVLFDDDLENVLARRDLQLVNGDFVKIFPVPSLVEEKVTIAGAVKTPGEFGFRANLRVSDLVAYAGGLLMQANKGLAEITRVTITPQGPETTRLQIRLFAALNNSPQDNKLLRPYDYLFIHTIPDWDINKTVEIAGEVKSPGTYAIKKRETLSSVLARADGLTDSAYLLGTVLLRESTKQIQKQQLKAAIDRLEARALATTGQKAEAGIDSEEAKRSEVVAKQQQMLIASLRKVEPLGRVVIRLNDPERLRGTPDDIVLEPGDKLMIPGAPGTVNVVGAVFAPTAVVYTPYMTVKDYLTMAGGSTEIADEKEIYVIKVNGGAVSRKGFSWLGAGWDGTKYAYHPGGLKSLTLDPGDTIVVPERLERIAWLKDIKDLATIIGNIALTAGVVLVGLRR